MTIWLHRKRESPITGLNISSESNDFHRLRVSLRALEFDHFPTLGFMQQKVSIRNLIIDSYSLYNDVIARDLLLRDKLGQTRRIHSNYHKIVTNKRCVNHLVV